MSTENKGKLYLQILLVGLLVLLIVHMAYQEYRSGVRRNMRDAAVNERMKSVDKLMDEVGKLMEANRQMEKLLNEKNAKAQRFGSVIGVKPEKLDYYKKLHADPWPSVNEKLRESNIQNYSIYLTQLDDGKWYLFSYFEYVGDDLDADMKKLSEDEEILRWWKETDPCQIPLESRKEGEMWKSMEEVYHLK